MISKKMKYALKALIHIANKKEEFVKANEIAEKGNIPKKFLEQILLELKKGRIINSKQGNVGGYYFVKDPAKVTLADIYRLIDGPIALVQCASKNFYEPCADCPNEESCIIRHVLIDVRDETLRVLEKRTIDSLAKAEVNNSSISWSI